MLLTVARDPGVRVRDIATQVGITERAAQRILSDLETEGYLSKTRVGRRNIYEVHPGLPLRHPVERHHEIGELLAALTPGPSAVTPRVTRRSKKA